jgi:hypothetical protein
VEVLVEGGAGQGGAVHVAQIGEAPGAGARARADQPFRPLQPEAGIAWVHRQADRRIQSVARARQAPEHFHHARAPAGDGGGQLLEQRHGPLAAPVADGVGDVDALAAGVQAADQIGCQQVANVGDQPVIAGLDRLVVPQPVDAAPDDGGLHTDARDQLLQRATPVEVGRVHGAVDRRQQVPQLRGVVRLVAVGGSDGIIRHGAPSRR